MKGLTSIIPDLAANLLPGFDATGLVAMVAHRAMMPTVPDVQESLEPSATMVWA